MNATLEPNAEQPRAELADHPALPPGIPPLVGPEPAVPCPVMPPEGPGSVLTAIRADARTYPLRGELL